MWRSGKSWQVKTATSNIKQIMFFNLRSNKYYLAAVKAEEERAAEKAGVVEETSSDAPVLHSGTAYHH